MGDKANSGQAANRTELLNVVVNFLSKSLSHFENAALSLVLIRLAAVENSIRTEQGYIVLQESHISLVTLESMDQYKQVNPPKIRSL